MDSICLILYHVIDSFFMEPYIVYLTRIVRMSLPVVAVHVRGMGGI